jgi:ribosomal protein S18 acetylase RimI-like enzyme
MDTDWEAVREIYDLSKPDEMRGAVDLRAIIPFEDDPNALRLFEQSDIIVMEVGGQVVAFAGNRNNYISWLFVHPDHRRRGIARKLITEILESLSGTIKLNVATNNPAARSLYESLGFTVEREFIGNFNGYESHAMTLLLEKERPTSPRT